MVWVVVDVLLVVVVLGLLGAFGLRLWRAVKALGREVERAGEVVGDASAGLEVVQPPSRAAAP